MAKRIGIFAGTFDPVHAGHLAFAEEALKNGLEKVMFLPEPRPRRKQGVRALEHRVAMVQLSIAENPRLGTIILEQARFTPHETLLLLQARFVGYQLVLLFGDDVISHIAHWPHVETLLTATELLIASRHEDAKLLQANLEALEQARALKFRYRIVYPDQEHISSSALRLKLKHGHTVSDLPQSVKKYIDQNKLYAAGSISS
ncbi:MAG: adenylyltransferase/cytidyltransferase family protein [Patescibacteria group bacterium]